MRFYPAIVGFLVSTVLASGMITSPAINGCISAAAASTPPQSVDVMRGMLIVEGTVRRCFVRFKRDGELVAPTWCRSRVPGLQLTVGWKLLDADLVLLNSQGQEILRLVKEKSVRLWRHREPDGHVIVFYPFSPEVQPHLN
jgi:hypothetical protein